MQDIKDIQRTNNLVTSYSEAEEQFTVTRNGAGKPTFIRGKRGRWVTQEATFNYDQSGNFTGLSKEIDTAMLTVLVSEASGSTGGGGASAFADLTDKTSADLPAINTPLANALATKAPALVTTDLGTNYTLTAADNGKAFNITADITVTAPLGLSPRPEVLFTAPPTGVFTLAPTGGTKLNNATDSMTFSRDTNPAGVVMRPYSEYDGYGVSASSGGGSGGSTTFAALTDNITVDLPAINTPLANALNPTPASISSMTALAATDNGKIYSCSAAFSTNVPNGLTPKPSTIFFPPATGNLTLTPTGGATLNGSASPITRAFTGTNKLGVALIPNPYDVNDYTVSGS